MRHQSWIHHMLDWYPDSTRWSFWIREEICTKDVAAVTLWPEHSICEEFNAARCI